MVSPLLIIILPFITVIIALLINKKRNLISMLVLLISIIITILVFTYFPVIKEGRVITSTLLEINNILKIHFRVDGAGFLFAAVSSCLWIFTIIYSFGYMKEYRNKYRYYIFLILSLGITMGVAFAGNLLTFYTFYELLTLATYPLVIHFQTEEAMQAGKKYLIYSLSGAAVILLAIMLTSFLTEGSYLNFTSGGVFPSGFLKTANIVFALLLTGFSVKAAVMPLHRWLPRAMVAPTPVSALFHAVAVVNSGVFGIFRIVYYVFGYQMVKTLAVTRVFLVIILITIILASVIAFFQDNLKRRLAYSTISQLGYISLGIFLLDPRGLAGGLYHIFNHALLKITLFFCAGAIYKVTHKRNISEMAGIGKRMPFTMGAFALASLGMVGIPPSVGFNSKWALLSGSFNRGSILIMGLLLLSAVLNAGYFFPIVINAFFKEETNPNDKQQEKNGWFEAPLTILIPIVILALSTIIFGVWYDLPVVVVEQVLKNIF